MANARAEPVEAVGCEPAHAPPLREEHKPAVNLAILDPRGFQVAVGVSWLSGLTGVGLLYYGAASDLLFLLGVTCLVFGAALFCTARAILSYSVTRVLNRFGMHPALALERSEALVSELCVQGMRGAEAEFSASHPAKLNGTGLPASVD